MAKLNKCTFKKLRVIQRRAKLKASLFCGAASIVAITQAGKLIMDIIMSGSKKND